MALNFDLLGKEAEKGLTPHVSKPPNAKFFGIDVDKVGELGYQYDLANLRAGVADQERRWPGMVAARNADFEQTTRNLQEVDPLSQREFVNRGLANSMGAFGAGSEGGQIGEGAGRNAIATSIARDTLGYEDVTRAHQNDLLTNNPEIALGLSGQQEANLDLFNAKNFNIAKDAQASIDYQYKAALQSAHDQGVAAVASGILGAL